MQDGLFYGGKYGSNQTLIPLHINKGKTAAASIKDRIDYAEDPNKTEKATVHFHELSDEIKTCEARLKEIGNLKKAIADYSKTRGTYEAYRKAGYSKKFFEEHREEITIHKAAKKMFDALPSKQIPKVKELSAEYTEVLERKKAAYKEYRSVKKEMQQYTVAQKNVEMLLGRDSVPERNARRPHR